ncbi:uncharacterized protein LOC132196341 isoform X2 [Neocloeon triangulifer]|uniref:uncharacterized protein LOC132196341 isoform X2 n=1 Tax=Neocloeon triangulifer TaxID=2078957 RepID=UPI00286F4CDF|nr:uncharacterized protein LOC132196341 isoform X2 [Neocloeon triangulifer]
MRAARGESDDTLYIKPGAAGRLIHLGIKLGIHSIMVFQKRAVLLGVCLAVLGAATAHPGKNENAAQGQRLLPSAKELHSKEKDQDAVGASPRFGFLSNSIYPGTYSTGTGQYGAASPLKLDLGGLLVGGAIGLGLIFLVPKLFYPYGARDCSGYNNYQARSTDADTESAATTFLTRLNDALAKNNIDTASCAQRALCSFVQNANGKVKEGSASDYEKVISEITSQASSENIFNSTEYQRALDVGRSGGDCAATFQSCKSNSDNVIGAVRSFMMSIIF